MPTPFILVAVTGLGLISTTQLPDETSCREARSIALFGLTIDQAHAVSEAAGKRRSAAYTRFYAEHPPREAATDRERQYVASKNAAWASSGGGGHVVDGKIQDDPPFDGGEKTFAVDRGQWIGPDAAGSFVVHDGTDIKTATCFPISTDGSDGPR